jgi:general secretion pathway protein M
LTNLLKGLIASKVSRPEFCSLVSNQTVRNREEQRFEKVAVNMRLRCHMSEFVKLLHSIESSTPMLFVEDLNVFKLAVRQRQSSRNRANNNVAADNLSLDIRFNLAGYLSANSGPAAANAVAGVGNGINSSGASTP